jgi:hypothetical protein
MNPTVGLDAKEKRITSYFTQESNDETSGFQPVPITYELFQLLEGGD